jgi:hypothetical protein
VKQAAAIVLVSLLCPSFALGQERTVALDAPMETTLGDAIDVLVTVTAAAGDDAEVPEQSFEPFEIISKKASIDPSPDGATQTFTFELQLLCFELGAHELGPVRVRITSAAGELIDLASNTASIEVRSVLANEPDPELKPASQPVIVEQDDYRLLILLGALLALAIGALLAWLSMRWWQNRERAEPAPPPPPPPWDTALAELLALERERPAAISEGRTAPWVDAVSDSIRVYLGRRFGFHGLESTTDEIADALAHTKSLRIAPEQAIGFLNQCDLVKFAKASLAEEASRALIQDALAMVDRTRPANVESPGGES